MRGLYNRGCYVRVLYSFMSFTVYRTLHHGTGHRMSVRRTLFSHNGRSAYLYSHMKNIDISGHVGDDRSTWLAYTGSHNFTNSGTHYDEVMLRIRSHPAYVKYVRHFKSISRRRSSAVYANFTEPTGGGTRTVGSRSRTLRRVSRITPPSAGRISQSAADSCGMCLG